MMDKAEKSGSAKLFWAVILGIVLYVVLDVVASVVAAPLQPDQPSGKRPCSRKVRVHHDYKLP